MLAVAGGGASTTFAQDQDRDAFDDHGAPPPRGLTQYRDDDNRAPAENRAADDDHRPQTELRQTFSQEELDQMLAPIALYPDPLLTQVLMASTYPIEVVQADRWVKSHGDLKGDELADALEDQPWDPSVKSLTNSPDVLTMMSEQLDWTVRLGDAFIGQEREVMDTVQKLRAKADEAGTLKSTPQQKVIIEREEPERVIVIEPAEPEVIYVPVYDPYVAYGRWWYPNYLPYRCYPRPYPRGYSGIWFGLSFHCGSPWGYAWGRSDWRHRRFLVDVNRHLEFNRRIDRARYASSIERRESLYHVDKGVWVHDPHHRRGVWYRDTAAAQRFNSYSRDSAARSREMYRGRTTGAFDQHGASSSSPPPPPRLPAVTSPMEKSKSSPADRNDRSIRIDRSRESTPINRDSKGNVTSGRQPPSLTQEKPAAPRESAKSDRDLLTRQQEGKRTASPNVIRVMPGRDRDDAFSSVDRDGASVRGESRRGEISRRPSLVRESPSTPRSTPAPIARPQARPTPSAPPPPSAPSQSGTSQSGGSSSSSGGGGGSRHR
jgi:hypothetical protein